MESSTRPSEEWRELTEFASDIAILSVDLSGGMSVVAKQSEEKNMLIFVQQL